MAVEHKVATLSELPNNSAKEVVIENQKILVGRSNGELFCVSGSCTHYGAPLVNSSIHNGRIKCQWHGACFSTSTGDIEDLPGLDSLQKYPIRVEGDQVFITTTPEQLATHKRRAKLSKRDPNDKRVIAIIGGGCAGSAAAESVRQSGFTGRIVLFSKESNLPLDRIKLSKGFDHAESAFLLRSKEFYVEHDVEILLSTSVTHLDHSQKRIDYQIIGSDESQSLSYDAVLVATGGWPVPLKLPGSTSKNVFTLRTLEDCHAVGKAILPDKKSHAVVIGTNFIGMEMAGTLIKSCSSVTVLGRGDLPFKPLGDGIGRALLDLFIANGVNWKSPVEAKELVVENGLVTKVKCTDGSELPCDLLVVGIGVEFKSTTSFISSSSGVTIAANGSIKVDEHLRAAPGFFAAGDIVTYPDPIYGEARIEHWGVAGSMGHVVGANMTAELNSAAMKKYDTVPYFFTMNFGKGVRYAGHALQWDEILYDTFEGGMKPDNLKFIAYFIYKGKITAVASMARDPAVSKCSELIRRSKVPSPDQIKQLIAEKKDTYPLLTELTYAE